MWSDKASWTLLTKKTIVYEKVENENVFKIEDQNKRFIKLRFDGIYSYASIQSLKFFGSETVNSMDDIKDDENESDGGEVTSKMKVVQCSSAQSGANAVNLLKSDQSVWKPVLKDAANSWLILDCDGYEVESKC